VATFEVEVFHLKCILLLLHLKLIVIDSFFFRFS